MGAPFQKPIIGISANIDLIDKEPHLGQERACLNYNYVQSIVKAGGIPLLLPVVQDIHLIQAQIELIDGLILSGGYDVQPLLYGEEPHPDLGFVHPGRDFFEIQALQAAYQQKKPVLGICRGLQVINTAFGGTLYQDLQHHKTSIKIKHSQQAPLHTAFHSVDITPSTLLHDILGCSQLGVNSFHHQAIKELAPGFIVNARTKDHLIEGIEKAEYPFLLGVQWHPERMFEQDLRMLQLFEVFVDQAGIYKSEKVS